MASLSKKTFDSILLMYFEVGFFTLNSSSARFEISNTMRELEGLKNILSLYFLQVLMIKDVCSHRWNDLIYSDNQSHNEILVVAMHHYQIEHISSQAYLWSNLLGLHLQNKKYFQTWHEYSLMNYSMHTY